MVAAGALIEPCHAVADVGIRARTRRHVQRALGYLRIGSPRDCSLQGRSATLASLRVLTHLRRRGIGIDRERRVVRLATHVAHRKHEVPRDPTLYCQAPLLVGGCEEFRIDSCGGIDRARLSLSWAATGRRCYSLLERNERKSRTRQLLAGVIGWVGVGPVTEVILQIVVDSKAGPHR